jgi:acetolactate synthase-1/3 small subunit
VEALRLAQAFEARTVDATLESFVFELTGTPADIDRFVNLMTQCGLVEVARTGLAALSRGAQGM